MKSTLPISLWDVKFFPTSAPPLTRFITPFGNSTCSVSFANSAKGAGASSDDFITTVFPAASAGATLVAVKNICEFHGMIHAITPIGSLTSVTSISGLSMSEIIFVFSIFSASSA